MPIARVAGEVAGGLRPDIPGLILPEGLWTDARNVRFRDGSVEKVRGYERVMGSLSATCIFASSINTGTTVYWLYAGQNIVYATDGTTHANVTNLSGTPNASLDLGYTGGNFHGQLVLNDGVGVPQVWSPGLANRCVSLTAWPAGVTAQVMRSFKDQLIALRITDGTYNPREIRWSDFAGPGALPDDWDYTDPANSAGRTELGETDDILVDCLALRDSLIVYKQFHTFIASPIDDDAVFQFRLLFSQSGLLSENCAVPFGARHFAVTDSDIVVHDGNSVASVADQRMRRWFFNRLNANAYRRTFVVADYRNREMFVCFPESGQLYPTMAIVWNWADDSWHIRELGRTMSCGSNGIIPGTTTLIDADTRAYDDAGEAIDDEAYNPAALRAVMVAAERLELYQLDSGETYNGAAMTCYAERTGIGLSNIDLTRFKRIKRIMPRVLGTLGDTLRFYVGTRAAIDGPVTYTGPYTFTIGQEHKIELRLAGRFLDFKVEYLGTNTFRLFGWDIEYEPDGYR